MTKREVLATAVPTGLVAAYMTTIKEITAQQGFWLMLPLWALLFVGLMWLSVWLRTAFRPRHFPTADLVDTYQPRPCVRAYDWDAPYIANDETIAEAFVSAKEGQRQGLVLFDNDWQSLTLEKLGKGWEVQWRPDGDNITRVAVPQDSKWFGVEVKDTSWGDIFRKHPSASLDEDTARALIDHFLGKAELPSNIGWATIRHMEIKD